MKFGADVHVLQGPGGITLLIPSDDDHIGWEK